MWLMKYPVTGDFVFGRWGLFESFCVVKCSDLDAELPDWLTGLGHVKIRFKKDRQYQPGNYFASMYELTHAVHWTGVIILGFLMLWDLEIFWNIKLIQTTLYPYVMLQEVVMSYFAVAVLNIYLEGGRSNPFFNSVYFHIIHSVIYVSYQTVR